MVVYALFASVFSRRAGLLLAGLLAAGAAPAAQNQPLQVLQDTARNFLEQSHPDALEPPEVEVYPPDPRLRLAACHQPLEAFLPSGARGLGHVSVGVRCAGPTPWTVYLRARVRLHDQVLVAARYLERGQVLGAADLSFERRDLATLPGGYSTDLARLEGQELRRSLRPGTVVSPRHVTEPRLIRRGEQVTLVVRHQGLEVRAQGVALSDGIKGQRLRVRNNSSQRIVEGTVVGDNRVQVRM